MSGLRDAASSTLLRDWVRPGEGACSVELVRVLLVEDHAIFRELFASVFEEEPGFEVVAQVGTLAEAREVLEGVDVAVVDLDLPDGEGTDLIGELRTRSPHAVALVLTASLDLGMYAQAVEAGAAGILHKSSRIEDIVDTVRRLRSGEQLVPRKRSSRPSGSSAASACGTTRRGS